jgi:hypothetical protein
MLNFCHKPCCPDGNNALKIAQKIRKLTGTTENKLNFLLKKRLDTKDLERIEIANINDFPRINKRDIRNSIFFGSFQLNQCRSYVGELLNSGIAFNVTTQFVKKITNKDLKLKLTEKMHKIIAVEIASRHKRSEVKVKKESNQDVKLSQKFKLTYKVFILYESFKNHPSGVKGIFYSDL